MSKNNVISLKNFKKVSQMKEEDNQFASYLSSLGQSELKYEAEHLIENFSTNSLSKSALLMDELAKRVSSQDLSLSISQFADEIREKISYQNIH